MISGKSILIAGIAAALSMVAGPSAIAGAGDAAAIQDVAQPRMLSAAELEAYRTGRVQEVPDGCWVYYNHFTGECGAVICIAPGGWQSVHECSEFGL
ncbi:hypothetical protein [Maricaulis sp.]|uniref:hypothetical protein n=1 Tax=Maricaulis sp. TaxID=1486257 RepID=UPI003A93E27F